MKGVLTADDKKALFLKKNKVVCKCKNVKYGTLVKAATEGCCSISDMERETKAHTGGCKGKRCRDTINDIIQQYGNPAKSKDKGGKKKKKKKKKKD